MKTPSVVLVAGLALTFTLAMGASNSALSPAAPDPHAGGAVEHHASDCGGEPCDAVVRGFRAFFDRELEGTTPLRDPDPPLDALER